jgi:Na+-driven multidrug efflux pump
MGKKQIKESREAANQLVWFVGILSVIIMVIVYIAKPLILNGLLGTITDEVRRDANTYLMITAVSIPFLALYNAGAAIFRTWVAMFIDWIVKAIVFIWHYISGKWTKFQTI